MKININIQLITAAILAFGGMVLLYCGLYSGEEGQIEETVLVAFGEVMTFSGSLMGIDYRYRKQFKQKDNDNTANQNPDNGQGSQGTHITPLRRG